MLATVPNDSRYKMVEKTMKKLNYDRSALIETLHTAQESFGYLENETLKFIARRLKLPFSKVYGVVTFYHFFRLKPKGRHTIVVCTGTACYIKNSNKILEQLEKKFGIKVGETTKDNLLSLLSARCVGSCSLAPIAIYDNKTVGHLSLEESVKEAQELIKC
ncbi:bidirectional hydrogenase complex protein HoxE [Halarcobacter anaerophilus]|nr:bidirectional hydrogenase complex protein HoxE [Halarcobacter anaerophilus]QDF30152.1 bidirectional [Ni-Fe] hydrogenase complex, diaphorase protein HoxE [Halarcobacter anaerophilus]